MSPRWGIGSVLDCGCHVPAGTIVVPLSMAEVTGLAATDRCDFCGQDVHGQTCARFTTSEFCRTVSGVHVTYDDAWWGCSSCTPMVTARAWRKLADRVLAVGSPRHLARPGSAGTAMVRAEVTATWMDMERHGLAGPVEVAA